MIEGVRLPDEILVVGCGFIGSAIARVAIASGIRVTILTRSMPSALAQEIKEDAELVIADATDAKAMASAVQHVDHVFYTVGDLRAGIADTASGGDLALALPPLASTLEACRVKPGLRFTFLSSGGTVYGTARKLPISEDHPTQPLVTYGNMKLTCEKYISLFAGQHGINSRIIRCANAFGEGQPGDRPQGVVGVFLERLASGLPVTLFGDGSTMRDFVYVDDVANAILALHAAPVEPRTLNLGSGTGTSLNELVKLIELVTGDRLKITWEPPRPFDVDANVLDISAIRRLIDFRPRPLEEGIRITWQKIRQKAISRAGPLEITDPLTT